MVKHIANRWRGVGSAYPRGLFANGELGCWFDCNRGDAFTDTARTNPSALGNGVGGLTGRSGTGLHASQATALQRPLLSRVPPRGRKNVLLHSTNLADPTWAKTGATVTAVGDGSFTFTDDATLGYHCVTSSVMPVDAVNMFARSIEVKRGTARYIFVSTNNAPTATNTTSIIDLDTNTVTQALTGGVMLPLVDLGGGWLRITFVATAPSTSWRRLTVGISPVATFSVGTNMQYSGTGSTVLLRRGQAELGSAFTKFQAVGWSYDVTEEGSRDCFFLLRDAVDDSLNVTLPDLGSAATLFYATEAGSVILPGQTIGAGPFDVLRGTNTFAAGAINRALTAAETATLTRYLDARRAAA